MALKRVEDHFLVPKHEILPEEEASALLVKLGTKRNQLPRLTAADPVVESIGGKRGDVIKISRKSLTAGKSIYYRLVT